MLLVGFGFLLSLFGARLLELQAIRGDELAASALGQRIVTSPIPATRGKITDNKGRPLAVSVEVRDITADQQVVGPDGPAAAEVLSPILEMPAAELEPLLTGTKRFIYLKKAVPPQVWRDIQTWRADANNTGRVLQGIFSERRTIRDYPNGSLSAGVVGFVNDEGRGAVGLEYGLDAELAGTPGSVTYERSAEGTEIPTSDVQRVDPQPGTDVRLTLDADLQWAAQNAVAAMVKKSKSDFGMAVVIEIGTGRVLAMVTAPSFDPNDPGKVKPERWTNRPVTWGMEPGSTAKLMSISAVLDQGALNPRSKVVVPGLLTRGSRVFRDSHAHGIEQLTLAGVLAESSNIGTILASEEIGGRKLYDYLKAYGVGEPSGVDYPGAQTGYVPAPSDWSDSTFPTLAFGQGMSLTALQIANIVATIGNDGVRVQPRLIDGMVRPDGTSTATAPVEQGRVISRKTAQTMQRMMQLVLQEGGTAAGEGVPGYLMGGKTGTALRYDEKCGCYSGYTASFLGMAPADEPRLAVGAWFDHPRAGYYGSELAAPVVKKIMTAALASQNIPATGGKPAHFPLRADGPR